MKQDKSKGTVYAQQAMEMDRLIKLEENSQKGKENTASRVCPGAPRKPKYLEPPMTTFRSCGSLR